METIKREGFMAFFLITEPADYKFFLFWNHISVSISISYM